MHQILNTLKGNINVAVLQLRPTILYTIISKNGELAILDERTYWIMEDQVKQLLSLGKSGILVSWIIQDQINRLCILSHIT